MSLCAPPRGSGIISANDLLNFKIIDEIIPEPLGGAHRDKNLIL